MLDRVLSKINDQKQTVIDLQRKMVNIPALSPNNGGEGERDKAEYLKSYLASIGLTDIKSFDAPDPRVPGGVRPNFAVIIPGQDTSRTFWSVGHMDVVPPGDASEWKTNPFELVVDGDTLYGRGVEDDQHGIVGSLLLAKALVEEKIVPPINYGILLVSDEETNNQYGINYVMENHKDFFGADDMFLVPDFGTDTSDLIDIAEKSVFWLKFTVQGQQAHASRPDDGCNSLTASAALIVALRDLYKRFDLQDPLFTPPRSTFEATKKESNVGSINILPGRDVFYMDCRVLPPYDLEDVLKTICTTNECIAKDYGVTVSCDVVQRTQAADPTHTDSDIVKRLITSIRDVYGCEAKPVGVSCFTVSCGLRKAGFSTAAWSTFNDSPHKPNEHSSIALILKDAAVMARVLFK
ncbi:MAG: M20 family metallo-hydrolase [Alphaproteobacteria bacterium]|nr:M20 family metallo-hydrolase [Alphaproteobacteria bacterium]